MYSLNKQRPTEIEDAWRDFGLNSSLTGLQLATRSLCSTRESWYNKCTQRVEYVRLYVQTTERVGIINVQRELKRYVGMYRESWYV